MLVYDDIGPFQLAGPMMVFSSAGVGDVALRLVVCAADQQPIRTSVGSFFAVSAGLDELSRADAVIIPGWRWADAPAPAALIQALRAACARGAQIMGICLGVIVLAQAGLLKGKRVTAFWADSTTWMNRFADVDVDDRIPYTHDENIWTSAGGVLAIDACLQLVQALLGARIANEVSLALARAPLPRAAPASVLSHHAAYRDGNRRLQSLLSWMSAHPEDAQSLDCLAARAHMTVRTFTRRFRALTGMTAVQWRLALRLKYAQRLLDEGDAPIERIAERVGFSMAASLRRHFQRRFGVSPSDYRRDARARRATMMASRDSCAAPGH